MNPRPGAPIAVARPEGAQLAAALDLALRPLAAAERKASVARAQAALARGASRDESLRAAASSSPGSGAAPDVFAAWILDRLVGAVWLEPQPGQAVVFSRPQLIDGAPGQAAVDLLRAASDHVIAAGAILLEALLEVDADADLAIFLSAGFTHACDLLYLVCTSKTFPVAAPAEAASLEFSTVGVEDDARLAAIIERTYQGTLDCPQLNGVRSAAESLEGYRTVGQFSRDLWLIVRHAGGDVGCLLLADHPVSNHWELVYMGLVPDARGRGWGAAITRYAQYLARRAGRDRLVLAVDAANEPAVAMYRQAGLAAWDRRRALLRALSAVR